MGGSLAVMAGEGGLSALTGLLDTTTGLIASVSAAALVLAGAGRWLIGTKRKPGVLRALKADGRAIRDTLVGRDAVHDSITGDQIAPAIPGIGQRMAHQESETGEIKDAVISLSDSVAKLVDLRGEMADLTGRVSVLEQVVGHERVLQGIESVQMLQTIEAVAKAQPPDEPRG